MHKIRNSIKCYKLTMFAVLIFSIVSVSVSAVSGTTTAEASAQTQDDSERLAQKTSDIKGNFAEYLKTQQEAPDAESQIRDVDQKIIEQKELNGDAVIGPLVAQKAALETKLDALLQQIDALQEQSYELHEIPEAKMQKLEQVKKQATQHYAKSGMLDTVFIDAAEESVQVIMMSAPVGSGTSDPVVPKRSPRSTGDDPLSLAGQYGITVEVKEFTPSSSTAYLTDSIQDCNGKTKNSDCGSLAGGVEICVRYHNINCNRATLGFPATRNGVSGFVTVAHSFDYSSKKSNGAFGDYRDNVYQVGPSQLFNNDNGRQSNNFDQSHANQLIGTLVYGTYGTSAKGDSAFVQLQSGARTLQQEVVSSGTTNFSISGYSEADGDRSAGTYVTKSGMKTGVTAGMIRSSNSTFGFATYNECIGDSGSPVGRLSGSSFTVTGMHLGFALIQTTPYKGAGLTNLDTQSTCHTKRSGQNSVWTDVT